MATAGIFQPPLNFSCHTLFPGPDTISESGRLSGISADFSMTGSLSSGNCRNFSPVSVSSKRSYPTDSKISSMHGRRNGLQQGLVTGANSFQRGTLWGENLDLKLQDFSAKTHEKLLTPSPSRRKLSPRAVFQWSKKPEYKGTMPRVIVVTSGKGGVGKTTITANLGMSLARLEFKVVAIDCDVGLRNLDLLLGLEARVLYTVQDVINGEARLDQALIRDKRCPNFELLCISRPRSKVDLTFSGKSLLLLVESLRDRPEGCPHFILLDCPAGIEAGFITAITPANEAIIVTTPDVTCLRDADRVAGLLECDGITDVKLLVNRVRADLIKAGQMMSVSDVREMLGIPLLGVIPEDASMIGASNEGMPLVLKKPPAMAGLAIEAAAWRLISGEEMNTVLLPEEKKKSFGIF